MNDTLQYALHNEGSVRFSYPPSGVRGAYDYYIKDRQGNIRTVLTEGRDTATYQATIEPALQTYENALFSNIYGPVTWVNKSTIAAFDTDPANTRVIKLNSGGNKTGAGLTLKVMAGDKVQVNCFAYYNTATQAPSGPSLLNDILAVLPGAVVSNSGGKIVAADQSTVSSLLSPNITNFLSNRTYNNALPKAYLNWVLVDNQFKYVQGGVVQVLAGSSKQALVASLQTMSKNGYLYVYVSNESPQDVFFDDVTVKHYTGALVQEQSYYPFGLQMAAISDKALKKNNTPYKYNGGVELEEELNYYNTFFRKYDAQIGRFTGIDILSESTLGLSPFHYGNNNPVMFNDPSGAKSDRPKPDGQQITMEGIIDGLWRSQYGGTWSLSAYVDAGGGGGSYQFGSHAEAFGFAAGYMDRQGYWGTYNYASSFDAAYSKFGELNNNPNSPKGYNYANARLTGGYSRNSYRGGSEFDNDTKEDYFYAGYGDIFDWSNILTGFALHNQSVSSQLLEGFHVILDVVGTIPLAGELADGLNGFIYLAQGDKVNAGFSFAACIPIAGTAATAGKYIRKVTQAHHLIPNQIFKENRVALEAMGWSQSHADNLMDLPVPFHGNHPAYNRYMRQEVENVLNNGGGLPGMINLQNQMNINVQNILNGGTDKLNNYYKTLGY